jgi:hypothetical protein
MGRRVILKEFCCRNSCAKPQVWYWGWGSLDGSEVFILVLKIKTYTCVFVYEFMVKVFLKVVYIHVSKSRF